MGAPWDVDAKHIVDDIVEENPTIGMGSSTRQNAGAVEGSRLHRPHGWIDHLKIAAETVSDINPSIHPFTGNRDPVRAIEATGQQFTATIGIDHQHLTVELVTDQQISRVD